MNFNHYQPTRIHFGTGEFNKIGELAGKYGKRCLLVMQTNNPAFEKLAKDTEALLTNQGFTVLIFDQIRPNPTEMDILEGIKISHDFAPDCILSIGGGSVIDSAKVIAYYSIDGEADWTSFYDKSFKFKTQDSYKATVVPLISVPTTAGTGSNVTQAAVVSDMNNKKTTVFRQEFFAKETVIDPNLTMTLPASLTASTGFDAFCHLAESYYNGVFSPICEQMALSAIRMIGETLPKLMNENKIEYREKMSLADLYAGICLSNGGGNAPHFYGEIISSRAYVVNHGCSLALTFPHFAKVYYNERMKAILDCLKPSEMPNENGDDAYNIMIHFLEAIKLPTSLKAFDLDDETLMNIRSDYENQTRFEMTEKEKRLIESILG